MAVLIVILLTTLALVLGAAWGAYLRLPEKAEGFLVAVAGGALIVSLMDELIRPSVEVAPLWLVCLLVFAGATLFSGLDAWADRHFAKAGGIGLLLAVTLDGVPENLALGTALIGADVWEVAALAGAIFLSNLPEAAGGAQSMVRDGRSRLQVMAIWTVVAALLSLAALIGWGGFSSMSDAARAAVSCFAAGAVVASLATEIFPKSAHKDPYVSGVAVALGLCIAVLLGQIG